MQVPLNPRVSTCRVEAAEWCTIPAAKTRIPYKITYFNTYFILLLIITFGQPRPCVVVGAILSQNAKPRSLSYDGGAVIGSLLNSDASLEVFLLLWQVSRCLITYQGGPMWSDVVISHTHEARRLYLRQSLLRSRCGRSPPLTSHRRTCGYWRRRRRASSVVRYCPEERFCRRRLTLNPRHMSRAFRSLIGASMCNIWGLVWDEVWDVRD